jgi:hypothetical protein
MKKSGKRHVPLAKVKVKSREIPMTKSEAEEKGKAVIAYIETNCDRETKWAHDVLAATVRNKAAAKDVRYEAHDFIKGVTNKYQRFVDDIYAIIDMVPEEYSHDARTKDEVENPVELPSVPKVNELDILDAIKKNHEGKNTKSRAVAVVLRELTSRPPAKLFDLKLEHWLRHQNCGHKTANFIMQTLANMRGAA